MDADLFLQQFGHLAQGNGGIKKLRDVILQLAVRGKLVEQNPADEPAEVLLKKILKKKESILGKSKVKNLHKSLANEIMHDLPSSWVHTTLDVLGIISPRNDCDGDTVAGFVPMTLISEGYGVFPRYEEKKWSEINKGYTHFANDDVGLAKITPCFENSKSCVFRNLPNSIGAGTTELHIFRDVTKTIVPAYIWIWIKSPEFLLEGERRMTGSAGQKRVPKDYFALKPFPLPPLAEQKRIVAKVDELMALCDKLEAEQKAQRTLKTQAVQSTLHHLTKAESPANFGTGLNILERTFGNWFDDLATVKHLRATILQLAVQGKLVPQDPTDEPASELLKRIEAEKKRLKIKTSAIVGSTAPHSLPSTWARQPLGQLISMMDSGWSPACEQHPAPDEDSWGVLKTTAVQIMRYLDFENKALPSKLQSRPEIEVKAGDLLITRAGPRNRVGISCLVEKTRAKLMISDKIIRFHLVGDLIYERYVSLCLNAGETNQYIELAKSGMADSQLNISQDKLKAAPIPLPPLAEQKRIVAKVDELMALCDQLEAQITQAQTFNIRLMDSLIHLMTKAA